MLKVPELERFFKGYGNIAECKMMRGFAFVEFEDPRDAKDAQTDLDGKSFLGNNLRIEFARSRERGPREGRFE